MTISVLPAPATSTGSVDWGRTVMAPMGVLLGLAAVLRLVSLLDGDRRHPVELVASAASAAVTAAFYVLVVRAYLRRGPASATSSSVTARLAAPVATFLPFALPLVGRGGSGLAVLAVGQALLLVGFAVSVWSLRSLDRSLSVVPQARALVQSGPYASVRHPLYLGELVAMLGLALTLGGGWPLVLWVCLALLQAYRAVREEELLVAHLPDYAAYQLRTARIVPGLF